MSPERIFFKEIKEDRGWYFVEYTPPLDNHPLAFVNLVIPDQVDQSKIIEAMESEAYSWLSRYPIPVEVSAFDGAEHEIQLKPSKGSNTLIAYIPTGSARPILQWEKARWSDLPQNALDRNYLRRIYRDAAFTTSTEIERETKKWRRTVFTINSVFFIWAVVVPLTVIILGETSAWISRMVLLYSLWKVLVEILKRTGKWKKSARQLERDKEEREAAHHHYHCKKNPQGFLRLKIENFDRDTRERVRNEAEALKHATLSVSR
jgi:hypothetical protein